MQKLKIEEYRQTLEFMRHYDKQAWTILGLSGTLALALWAYAFKDVPFWSIKAVIIAFFGVAAIVVGRLMARRLTAHTISRFLRAVELERELGFELIARFDARRPRLRFAPSINKTLDWITWTVLVAWVIYLVLAVQIRAQ